MLGVGVVVRCMVGVGVASGRCGGVGGLDGGGELGVRVGGVAGRRRGVGLVGVEGGCGGAEGWLGGAAGLVGRGCRVAWSALQCGWSALQCG